MDNIGFIYRTYKGRYSIKDGKISILLSKTEENIDRYCSNEGLSYYTATEKLLKSENKEASESELHEIMECFNFSTDKEEKIVFLGSDEKVFLKFVSIDIKNESEITSFYNEYGLIGIRKHTNIFDTVGGRHAESIEILQIQLELMKHILWLKYNALNCNNYSTLLNEYGIVYGGLYLILGEDIYHCTNYKYYEYFNGEININQLFECLPLEELRGECISILAEVINQYLKFITPHLKDDVNTNEIFANWEAETLLAAMYFEIFMLFNDNKIIRKCKNKTCNNYFEIIGNDTRKIYCSTRCAQLEAKRKQRLREKEGVNNGNNTKKR